MKGKGLEKHKKWELSPSSLQKVNWDVAVDKKNGCMGMTYESHSAGPAHVLATKSFTIVGTLEPVVAEALATLHAVEFNQDLRLRRIILEGDELQVVNAVKSTGHKWNKYVVHLSC